jgi:glycosyltransferase involved in cell wall biosynthesis
LSKNSIQPNSTPIISVIIPAHNAALFISQTIESVLRQTLTNLEIMVIDDGSTDETAKIVRKYQAPVRLLSQKKRGVSAARNLGIRQAQGEFIAFLDADDLFIEPDKLEKQLQIIIEKNCDIVTSGWQVADEHLNKISDQKPWLEVPHLNLFNWLQSLVILPSTMLLRRAKLLEVGGFDETLTNSEDIDLIFRMALTGSQAEWLPQVTVSYRRHSANATNQIHRQAQGFGAVLKKFFGRSDLPPAVRQIEREVWFRSLTASAYDCFVANDLAGMKKYLLDSAEFSDFSGEGLLIDWFYTFERYSAEGEKIRLDVDRLFSSKEWAELEAIASDRGV